MADESERVRDLEAQVKRLESKLARSEKSVRALRDVGLALGSTLDLDQILELILGKISELLNADRATLYLLDEHRGILMSRVTLGGEVRSIELPVGQGIAGYVAKFGKTARVRDAYEDARFSRTWDDLTGYRTTSILAAPMRNHVGRTIGVVQVLNKRGRKNGFSKHDEELLSSLSTQAAISIDNSRLFLSVIQKNMQLVETKEQLEHRIADLALLFELETSMSGAGSLEDLSRAVISAAARACGARAGGLLLDEGEAGVFLYFVEPKPSNHATRDAEVRRYQVKRGDGLLGYTMLHDQSVQIGPQDPPTGPIAEAALMRMHPSLEFEVESAVVVPLEGENDKPFGALGLYNAKNPHGFTQEHRSLLRLVSANASTAVRLFISRAEREKSERLTAIGRLLSSMMHDMRTPLTVISGYVQLMSMADDANVRNEHVRLILKQFDAISAMQREILEFARGERSILVRKVYLTKFFGDLERQLALELERRPVSLVVTLEDRGVARFDEAKVTRLVHNLVRNAVEAMEPHGEGQVTVRAFRRGTDFVLSISDTGRGIPEKVRERLFQSFVTSGKQGGTGLGLAIVKKIVDEHGGYITVDSSVKGTTFTIVFPQESAAARASGETNTPAAKAEVQEDSKEKQGSRPGDEPAPEGRRKVANRSSSPGTTRAT